MGKQVCCYDCGLAYGSDFWVEAVIPDKIWKRISPIKSESGILCISCMAKRLKELKIKNVPVWLCGTEPFIPIVGDPHKYKYFMRTYDIEGGE